MGVGLGKMGFDFDWRFVDVQQSVVGEIALDDAPVGDRDAFAQCRRQVLGDLALPNCLDDY